MANKMILDFIKVNDVLQFVEYFELDQEYQELFGGRADDYIHEQLGYSSKDVIDNLLIRLEERNDCYSSVKSIRDEEYEIELYELLPEDSDADI